MKLLLTTLAVVATLPLLLAQPGRCTKGTCLNGYGEYVFSNGDEYKGDFQSGKMHGQGILYYKNGDKYLGNWLHARREGRGRLIMINGDVYFGMFVQDRFQGDGELTFANGDRYEGQFKNGLFDGQGTMHYADGSQYVGRWSAGQRVGAGQMQLANGETLNGEWEADQYRAEWARVSYQGDTTSLRNCNANFCATGIGKYTYHDGTRFIGDFLDGKPEGTGMVYYKSGQRYEGQWRKDQPNGKGVMHYTDGKILGAIWENGTPAKRLFEEVSTERTNAVMIDYDPKVKIWAVVIGAARYSYMPVLRYTDDDAYQIYAFLKSPEGGALPDNQMRLLIDEDATRSNILYAMRSVFTRADENDVVLFYFSGHGIEGAFLPIDYDGNTNLIYHHEVRDMLMASRAKHKIVLADACHSGGLLALKTPNSLDLQKLYKAFETTKGGTALMMSSKGEEYSLEDGGLRSGVFSHFVIRGLKGEADQNGNGIVSIQELYNYVYRQVRRYTANVQTPTISGSYDPEMPISVVRRP
ncbi:MAG TPA: caspase family protein [Saprospiraceae bacterium]|nr:caspase family protein [Saprospiraceae bacterium]HMP24285.1 caspase family protein [Saprospiraceae bacterium]